MEEIEVNIILVLNHLKEDIAFFTDKLKQSDWRNAVLSKQFAKSLKKYLQDMQKEELITDNNNISVSNNVESINIIAEKTLNLITQILNTGETLEEDVRYKLLSDLNIYITVIEVIISSLNSYFKTNTSYKESYLSVRKRIFEQAMKFHILLVM